MSMNSKYKQKHALKAKLPPLSKLEIGATLNKTPAVKPKDTSGKQPQLSQPLQQRSKAPIPLTVQTRAKIALPGDNSQISISGSPIASKAEPSEIVPQGNDKHRAKEPPNGKMSLVCELKLKTLRREVNLLKQTIPPTDDVIEILREKAAFDLHLLNTLKKTGITSRWDLILDHVQEHPQPGIFGLWEYVMRRGNTQLQPRLQETFDVFVNHHFERDLQNLQLNKDRQNRVAKVMLHNMQKAEGYIDSLNLSIWEYQRYTEKISSLVKDHDRSEDISDKDVGSSSHSPVSKHSASYIHLVYHKLESYVNLLEQENVESTDEIEALKIKLYEANGEIERIQHESKRFQMDNQDKAKQIKTLQSDKKMVQEQLDITNQKMDDLMNDKQSVNRKLDEMMNVMVKSMEAFRVDVKNDIKTEVGGLQGKIDQNLDEMESRMTARLDEVQDTIDVVQETQDTVKEDMERMEKKMDSEKHRKPKDKNVNLKISIKGATVPEDENDAEFKTISNKLRSVQRK